MAAYIVPPTKGLHFSFGPWPNCVIAAAEIMFVGTFIIVGTAPSGSEEYDAAGIIWGPGDIVAASNAAGGIGNFLTGLVSHACDVLKDSLNTHPVYAPETNATPASIDTINIAWTQYFKITPSADGTYPVVSVKPYP